GNVVATYKKIGPPVVVVIEEPCWKSLFWFLHACLQCDFAECSVVVIVIKKVVAAEIRNKKVNVAVIVIVGRHGRLAEPHMIDSRLVRDVGECAIAVVMEELAGNIFIADQ